MYNSYFEQPHALHQWNNVMGIVVLGGIFPNNCGNALNKPIVLTVSVVRSNFLSQWKQYSPDNTLDDILWDEIYLFLSPGNTWNRAKVSFSPISSMPTNK